MVSQVVHLPFRSSFVSAGSLRLNRRTSSLNSPIALYCRESIELDPSDIYSCQNLVEHISITTERATQRNAGLHLMIGERRRSSSSSVELAHVRVRALAALLPGQKL